ncbi:hypothetical protein scyTo_0015323, partial [Scyliorhinus torazame]|nr:hypothetical protein [Scyliorhinus torazame]
MLPEKVVLCGIQGERSSVPLYKDQVPDDKKLHNITWKEKFLRNKLSTANIYLK